MERGGPVERGLIESRRTSTRRRVIYEVNSTFAQVRLQWSTVVHNWCNHPPSNQEHNMKTPTLIGEESTAEKGHDTQCSSGIRFLEGAFVNINT